MAEQFKVHDDYPDMIGGPSPAPPIAKTAIVRQVNLWIPDQFVSTGETGAADREKWFAPLDKFIYGVYSQMARSTAKDKHTMRLASTNRPRTAGKLSKEVYLLRHSHPPYPAKWDDKKTTPLVGYPTRNQAVRIVGSWNGIPTTINISQRQEFVTIAIMHNLDEADLSKMPDLASALETYRLIRDSQFKSSPKQMSVAKKKSWGKAYKTIYHTITDEFHDDIISAPLADVGRDNVGAMFADFRGFEDSCERPVSRFFLKRFRLKITGTPPKSFPINQSIKYARAMRDFMETGRDFTAPAAADHPSGLEEFTVGRMLDGRALYISMLGEHPRAATENQPLTFHILSKHNDDEQRGRLIKRLFDIGTARRAALKDERAIDVANENLLALVAEFNKVGSDLSDLIKTQVFDGRIKAIATELFKASDELTNTGSTIKGGLAYRLSRSRYYQREFRDLIEDLRTDRIEGFRPYPQFVNDHLNATYDFINSVSRLRERLEASASGLYEQVRTTESLDQQSKIEDRTTKAAEFQSAAELIGGLFIVPASLNDVGQSILDRYTDIAKKNGTPEPDPRLGLAIPVAAFGIGISILMGLDIYRKRVKQEDNNSPTRRDIVTGKVFSNRKDI